MANDPAKKSKTEPAAPLTEHHGSSVVTIAFPFSNIQTRMPTAELREMATLLGELAAELAEMRPSPKTKALSERAQALIEKLA
jgi:hypothetical protein